MASSHSVLLKQKHWNKGITSTVTSAALVAGMTLDHADKAGVYKNTVKLRLLASSALPLQLQKLI